MPESTKRILPLLPPLLLALLGLGVAIGGARYEAGTLIAMGPGFMPLLLGVLLFSLGMLLVFFEARARVFSPGLPPLRPLLCAGGSIVLWALLAEPFGFVPAGLAQLVLAYAAMRDVRWKEVFLSSTVITALAYALFVLLLGIPLRAVGW